MPQGGVSAGGGAAENVCGRLSQTGQTTGDDEGEREADEGEREASQCLPRQRGSSTPPPDRSGFQVPLPSDFNSCESNNFTAGPQTQAYRDSLDVCPPVLRKREGRGWVQLPQLSLWCQTRGGRPRELLRRQQGGRDSPACPAWWPTLETAAATWRWRTLWSA